MKKFEFESNGSKWGLICQDSFDGCFEEYCGINGHKVIGSLKDITEEQASEIVSSNIFYQPHSQMPHEKLYFDYISRSFSWTYNSRESLHSLFKSKGIHLYENPYRDDWDELCTWGHGCFAKDGKSSFELFTEAEAKTFDNPVLFKIICN